MTLSVVTLVNNDSVFKKGLYRSLQKQDFQDYELKVIDNRTGRYASIAHAYNAALRDVHGGIVMFVHPDIIFLRRDALARMVENVRACMKKEKRAAVFGVAGACFGKVHCGISAIKHGADKREGGLDLFPGGCYAQVQTVDACCFFMKRQVARKFRFWDELDGFHMCVEELCLRIQEHGLKAVVIPADLWHFSDGRSLDSTYYRETIKVIRRHRSIKYLNTTSFHWKAGWFLPVQLRFYQIRSLLHHNLKAAVRIPAGHIKKVKRRISLSIKRKDRNSIFVPVLEKMNLVIFHWQERARKISLGEDDPKHVYYVIRPRGRDEGLLSSYYYVLANVRWAKKRGYIPVVDFRGKNCQYHTDMKIRGTSNAWEYYFEQPSGVGTDEIYGKKNVLLSGWSLAREKQVPPVIRTIDTVRSHELKYLCQTVCPVNPFVTASAEKVYKKHFNGSTVLGVLVRGTDYVALQPKGHCRQPSVEQVIGKVKQFLSMYHIDKIFAVTEDYAIFHQIKEAFPDRCVFTSDDDFVMDYCKHDYVSESMNTDPYIRGLHYLIRLILLAKCDYLVAGITNGSLFALNVMEGSYKDSYWFELGEYGS